jgi:hypothetical protein
MIAAPASYLPVLRWKQGEITALRALAPEIRSEVRPLIERLPKHDRSGGSVFQSHVDFAHELKNLNLPLGVVLDAVQIARDSGWRRRARFAIDAFKAANNAEVLCVPGFGLMGRLDEARLVRRALGAQLDRASLRVNLVELFSSRLDDLISEFLEVTQLAESAVSLIVDVAEYHESHGPIEEMLSRLPNAGGWRDLSYLGGAFPPPLTFSSHSNSAPPRREWMSYKMELDKQRWLVSFGDYTTRWAIYEPPPPDCRPAVMTRHTTNDRWIVTKGTTVEAGGADQWIGQAQHLVESGHCKFGCCDGCNSIVAIAEARSRNYGNPTNWVRFSIGHHMTSTVRELTSLRPAVVTTREIDLARALGSVRVRPISGSAHRRVMRG